MPRPKRQSRTPARLSGTEAEQTSAKRRHYTGRPNANSSTLPVYNVSVATSTNSRPTFSRPSTASDVRLLYHKWHHRLVSQMLILVHLMLDHTWSSRGGFILPQTLVLHPRLA